MPAPQPYCFGSQTGFEAFFTHKTGRTLSASSQPVLYADWCSTPLGDMVMVTSHEGLHLLEFPERKILSKQLLNLSQRVSDQISFGETSAGAQIKRELSAYFDGARMGFETPLVIDATPFTRSVWAALRRLREGDRVSYSAFAQRLGSPRATRAVARANAANPFAIVVPCHRLVGANGALTGYGGGLWRKDWLLTFEAR